jgi:hypothetical protein
MALCPKCGVDIDQARYCPLCNSRAVEADASDTEGQSAQPDDENLPVSEFSMAGLTESEVHGRRVVATEVISVSMGIVAASVSVINLILSRNLTWSRYILVSLAFSWIMVCVPILFTKRNAIALPIITLAPFAYLLVLDALAPPLSWAFPLALPIMAAIEFAIGGAIIATRLSKRHGLNVVAFALLATTIVCLITDLVVGLYFYQTLRLVWSSIVAFATVPVAGFLIYFHHRIAKTTTLRKLFHL